MGLSNQELFWEQHICDGAVLMWAFFVVVFCYVCCCCLVFIAYKKTL